YWDAADLHERANGRLFKQIEFSLPVELTLDQQQELVDEFARHLTEVERLPYTLAIHKGGGNNPHCHLMISERRNDDVERQANQWFKRYNAKQPHRGGAQKSESLKPRAWLEQTRESWSDHANRALERVGHEARIDHRTLAAQRIDRLPQVHIGPNVAAMAERGILTDRWERFEAVNEYNQLRTEEAELELEIAVAVDALDAESRLESSEAAADALDIQPPVAASTPYVPDDAHQGRDDELALARESQRRDVEDHIGRKHWLQIRAEMRELYSIQQRLYDEREAAEWDEWISRPDVDPVSGRIITEWAVDACIERERALPENQPLPEPKRRVVSWPPKYDPELDMLKHAAAKQAAQAAPKPFFTPTPDESQKPPPAAPLPAAKPVPVPQASQEAAFDAKKRALEIVCMETAGERHAAFLESFSWNQDDYDALDIALEPLIDGSTGELTEKGRQLRAELVPSETSHSQRAPRVQSEQDWEPRSGPGGPNF
ncbi:MobA/MobL family protein, partial [Ralstonia pseudosolanacearum]|uniref:MobA/MobL family protein n=1 Tax=Ralstonia pseudosolanacearum TaxID=1310165 RepID=UPI003CFA0447